MMKFSNHNNIPTHNLEKNKPKDNIEIHNDNIKIHDLNGIS